jgi:hypothetical protein
MASISAALHYRCNIAAIRKRHPPETPLSQFIPKNPDSSFLHQTPPLVIYNTTNGPRSAVLSHADLQSRIVSLVAGEHYDCPVDPSSASRTSAVSLSLPRRFLASSSSSSTHRAKNNRRWCALPKERKRAKFRVASFRAPFRTFVFLLPFSFYN